VSIYHCYRAILYRIGGISGGIKISAYSAQQRRKQRAAASSSGIINNARYNDAILA